LWTEIKVTAELSNYQINSKLVWDSHQSLVKLAQHNTVQLIRVPGHEDTEGNKNPDQLARLGSESPFIGPELA
jgi:ribonuclease HI